MNTIREFNEGDRVSCKAPYRNMNDRTGTIVKVFIYLSQGIVTAKILWDIPAATGQKHSTVNVKKLTHL